MTDEQPPRGTVTAGDGARAASPSAPRPRRRPTDWRKRLEITLLAGPALVVFVGFVIFPVVLAGYYGFFRWKGFGPPTTSSVSAITLISSRTARSTTSGHNGVIVGLSLVIQGPIAIVLALLLNRKIRFQSLYACSSSFPT